VKTLERLSVLYIDNDETIIKRYRPLLESYCDKFYLAKDGDEGYALYLKYTPHIIIMDLYVAQYKGCVLAKEIRKNDNHTAFIALTKHADRKILLDIVELNFTSYLIKPSDRTQLLNALLKVSKHVTQSKIVILPYECTWDTHSKTLFHKDKQVLLTRREQKLFELLVDKNGVACGDDEIFFHVWEDDFTKEITNASIRTLVKNLRKKLPKELIQNQYGVGYKINL